MRLRPKTGVGPKEEGTLLAFLVHLRACFRSSTFPPFESTSANSLRGPSRLVLSLFPRHISFISRKQTHSRVAVVSWFLQIPWDGTSHPNGLSLSRSICRLFSFLSMACGAHIQHLALESDSLSFTGHVFPNALGCHHLIGRVLQRASGMVPLCLHGRPRISA